MKTALKHSLFRVGLFPSIDFARRLPALVGWLRTGCRGPAPPPIKRMVIAGYLRTYRVSYFVETGTYLGDTLADIARDDSIQATSVEVDSDYFEAATRRFRKFPNVTLVHGDSGVELSTIVKQLKGPALFWLDGHYSGGKTGKGALQTPVCAELDAILSSSIRGHVILIDDARCFNGTGDYPHLDQLLETVRKTGTFDVEVSTDIIRITPNAGAPSV